MYKEVPGRCPVQNIDYSISVEYLKSSSGAARAFQKKSFNCSYNIYGEKCSRAGSCPIYKSAPATLED